MNFDRCASSAQTALIVFSLIRKKLNAPLCFLFPQKPIGLFGVPEKIRFIAHRARFGDDASRRKAPSPSLRDTSPGGRGKALGEDGRPGLRGVECAKSIRDG